MNKENFQIRMNRLYKEAQAEGVAGRIGFAHKCQITKSQLNGYLDGNLTEICEVLLSIAKNNNVSVSWLVGEIDDRTGNSGHIKDIFESLEPKQIAMIVKITESLKFKMEYDHNQEK